MYLKCVLLPMLSDALHKLAKSHGCMRESCCPCNGLLKIWSLLWCCHNWDAPACSEWRSAATALSASNWQIACSPATPAGVEHHAVGFWVTKSSCPRATSVHTQLHWLFIILTHHDNAVCPGQVCQKLYDILSKSGVQLDCTLHWAFSECLQHLIYETSFWWAALGNMK